VFAQVTPPNFEPTRSLFKAVPVAVLLHSSIAYKTPAEVENDYALAIAA